MKALRDRQLLYHYSTMEFEALLWSSQLQNNTLNRLNTAQIFGPLKTGVYMTPQENNSSALWKIAQDVNHWT